VVGIAGGLHAYRVLLWPQKLENAPEHWSGDMSDSGLDVLNQGGDSIEVALAKRLVG
jgi:hypothetical protein